MELTRTLNIPGTREMLQDAVLGNDDDRQLIEPLQAVVGEITSRAERRPMAIYVCSTDADKELRNYFAFAAAKLLSGRLPDATVVDCDFLSVGLSNIVPEGDALGFLDLLLYGSSLDVITQKASNGVNVIGAGSFPVSRKSPFVMDAFEETVRYLLNHASCVVFCGPVVDDDDNIHPILGHVDLRVVVRAGRPQRANILEPLEERVTQAVDGETWLVRVTEPLSSWRDLSSAGKLKEDAVADGRRESQDVIESPPVIAPALRGDQVAQQTPAVDGILPRNEHLKPGASESTQAPAPDTTPAPAKTESEKGRAADTSAEQPSAHRQNDAWGVSPAVKKTVAGVNAETVAGDSVTPAFGDESPSAPEWEEVHEIAIDRSSGSSVFPRIMISTLGLLLVAFVVWWLYLTRSIRDQIDEPVNLTETGIVQSNNEAAEEPTNGPRPVSRDVKGAGGAAEPDAGSQEPAAPDEQPTPSVETTSPQRPDTTPVPTAPAGSTQPPASTPSPATSSAPSGRLADYSGQYLIHVSSFRRAEVAQQEADYFVGRGYEAFAVPVDLGSKGRWHRVYVGPFDSADDARRMKIRLDENPRVRSTRITKAP
jgi:cell division septation protein DedD